MVLENLIILRQNNDQFMVTCGIEQADVLIAWKVWLGTGKICLQGWDAQFPAVCKGNWYPSLVDSCKSHQWFLLVFHKVFLTKSVVFYVFLVDPGRASEFPVDPEALRVAKHNCNSMV